MPAQQLNNPMKVKVLSIKENASSFKGREAMMYCHVVSMLIDESLMDEPIDAQICTQSEKLDFFEVNDTVMIQFSDYRPGKQVPYTFKFIELVAHNGKELPKAAAAPESNNRMVGGTIADRALMASVTLFSVKPPLDKNKNPDINLIINTAMIFRDYFKNNL